MPRASQPSFTIMRIVFGFVWSRKRGSELGRVLFTCDARRPLQASVAARSVALIVACVLLVSLCFCRYVVDVLIHEHVRVKLI